MSGIKQIRHEHYRIGSERRLGAEQLDAVAALLRASELAVPAGATGSPLGGRGAVSTGTLPGIGSVVVKPYTRGGLLRSFVKRRYLRWGRTRSEMEYRLLGLVRDLGVNVPEPIAFASEGLLFYRAWLLTREVEGHRTLVEISLEDEERARAIIENLADQVGILIRNSIFHLDLHPGNVLTGLDGRVYLVDFDKASLFSGRPNRLRDLYLRRWRRAVIKHDLPEYLAELMCLRLRQNFE
jgi:3-deoxy-D-manno-octulosonic acid kinase